MKRLLSLTVYGYRLWYYGKCGRPAAFVRSGTCSKCQDCQFERYGNRKIIGWCGVSKTDRTCGCPVVEVPKGALPIVWSQPTAKGREAVSRMYAAPFRKTVLVGEKCPQRKW
jgi:hypothetical protein